MVDFKEKPKKFQRLKHKYRLVILNDVTFEEKVSLRLSQLNVFVVLGISSLLLILLVILLIAFTPLKEFIPGYANVNIRKQGVENFLKSDSIEVALAENNLYINNIKHIIRGELAELDDESVVDSSANYEGIKNEPIEEDSVLRNMIETEEKYNLFNKAG
ncbi:MAG: M23 family peptidase, partial [Vicingaceae bacterium]